MAKKIFRYAFPIICVLVVIITFYMLFNIRSRVDDELYNTDDIDNNIEEIDIVEDEIYEESENIINEVENEISNTVENTLNNDVTNQIVQEKDDIEEGSTSKKQEAISLVKKAWGEDSSVTYRCESVNSKGEYVVAVILKSSGSVKAYFNVNLETQKVEIDY